MCIICVPGEPGNEAIMSHILHFMYHVSYLISHVSCLVSHSLDQKRLEANDQ